MVGTRNYPLLIGAGIAVLLFSLVGAAAITGALPSAISTISKPDLKAGPVLETTAKAAAGKQAACKRCGVVAAVRAAEVKRSVPDVDREVEKHAKAQTVYRVTVRMDDGSERTLSQASAPAYPVGARVRVNGVSLERG